MATKKKTEIEEPEVATVTEDEELDIPVSDEVEIDDGELEDEEFFEETTEDDEDEEVENEEVEEAE